MDGSGTHGRELKFWGLKLLVKDVYRVALVVLFTVKRFLSHFSACGGQRIPPYCENLIA